MQAQPQQTGGILAGETCHGAPFPDGRKFK
jgi:hypothetical protein